MKDKFGREIYYIRISVTDRCNLRCFYCMPLNRKFQFIPHSEIMTYEEISRLVKNLTKLGIKSVRITGGEPLVRKNVVALFEMLSNIDGLQDLSMTTNGILFKKYGEALKKAGLKRVNFSLDTLKDEKFKKFISPNFSANDVIEAILYAHKLGFEPIKINIIPIAGFNDDEILDFVQLTKDLPLNIRFIELMPVSTEADTVRISGFISNKRVKQIIEEKFGPLTKDIIIKGFGPAEVYKIKGFNGSLGFISHISNAFCDKCNRIRLTSNGYLKRCLYEHPGIYIRDKIDDIKALEEIIFNKPKDFREAIAKNKLQKGNMFKIGG